MLGAIVAWSASSNSNHAGDLNQQAQQDFLLQQQILASAHAAVGEDLRRVADYQEQLNAERVLRSQADSFRLTQPDVAAILDEQAQGQAALARTTGAAFFAESPAVGLDGTVHYDRAAALDNLLSQYVVYQQLHPAQTQADANKTVKKYRWIVGVGVLFVAALFFLTVAEFARRRVRHAVVGLGFASLVAGCVIWPLIENGTLL